MYSTQSAPPAVTGPEAVLYYVHSQKCMAEAALQSLQAMADALSPDTTQVAVLEESQVCKVCAAAARWMCRFCRWKIDGPFRPTAQMCPASKNSTIFSTIAKTMVSYGVSCGLQNKILHFSCTSPKRTNFFGKDN